MKSTARNQYNVCVKAVESGPVTSQVTLVLDGGDEIVATMTAAAALRLDLKAGDAAIALIKASAVALVTDFDGWQLSARNQLAGVVSRIESGPVSCMVELALTGGQTLSATVTHEAVDALQLKPGAPATGVFKAFSVMVATRVTA